MNRFSLSRRTWLASAFILAGTSGFVLETSRASVDPLEVVAPSSSTASGSKCDKSAGFTCKNLACTAGGFQIPNLPHFPEAEFMAGSRKFTSDLEEGFKCKPVLTADDGPAPVDDLNGPAPENTNGAAPTCTTSAKNCGQFQYYADTNCTYSVPDWAQGNKPGYLKGCQ